MRGHAIAPQENCTTPPQIATTTRPIGHAKTLEDVARVTKLASNVKAFGVVPKPRLSIYLRLIVV